MGSSLLEKYEVVEQIDPERAMDAEVVELIDQAPTAPPTLSPTRSSARGDDFPFLLLVYSSCSAFLMCAPILNPSLSIACPCRGVGAGEGIIDIMTLESGLREDTHPMGAELRESKLMNKYNELKEAGKLDGFMERRRRKNASKDHLYMPYRWNGDGA
ncbi:Ankyrin repeat family protein [Zea mays]|uniref:rRNA biogenesis protein RRP36 n=1 Tax=Zea mays TaxID=4577 RepID=A0A1D6HWX1_MAIZE|nr:Ankyrin repeat family protein [Zea mays]